MWKLKEKKKCHKCTWFCDIDLVEKKKQEENSRMSNEHLRAFIKGKRNMTETDEFCFFFSTQIIPINH